MTSPNFSIVYSAVVSGTASNGSPGDVLIPDATSGEYVLATTAARGSRRSTGLALASYVAGGVVSLQQSGVASATLSGLGTGTASYVRVSSAGSLERVASPAAPDDVVGWCETDGTFHAYFGQPPGGYGTGGGGGGGATLPIVLTTDVSGILPAANGGTGASSLPAGGLAGLTALASGDAASVATAAADATTKANAAVSTAATASATAITAERTATRTLTGATIAGASNTLSVRIANDVTGLASGVATFLATPSSANLIAALTDETGTGDCVFGTAPLFKTTINLNNPGNTFKYVITPAAIAADRILNLPLLTGTDTVVTAAFTQTLTNKTLTDPYINGQKQGAAVAVAAMAIDWTLGNVFTKTLSAGANTFTFSNQASGMAITVRVTGAASTVTWPTVKWAGGSAPVQTASGTDVYTFIHDGTSIYGSVVQAMA